MLTLPDRLQLDAEQRRALREAGAASHPACLALADAARAAVDAQRTPCGACAALDDAQAGYLAGRVAQRFAQLVAEHDGAGAAADQLEFGELLYHWRVDPGWIGLVDAVCARTCDDIQAALPAALARRWRGAVARRMQRDAIWQMSGYARAARHALARALRHPLRDPELGLYTREALDDLLGTAIERVHRHGGKLLVALVRAGAASSTSAAQPLRALVERLAPALRPTDLAFVYDASTVALVFEDLYSIDSVGPLFERLLHDTDASGAPLALAVGATAFPDDHHDAAALLRHAERALRAAGGAAELRLWQAGAGAAGSSLTHCTRPC